MNINYTFDDDFLTFDGEVSTFEWIREDSLGMEKSSGDIDLAQYVCEAWIPEEAEILSFSANEHDKQSFVRETTDFLRSFSADKRGAQTFVNRKGKMIRGKPCLEEGCDNRRQSKGLCKSHGGGKRCIEVGCTKSSQGNQRCRSHGGGKQCSYTGCIKGTQKDGSCYLHYKKKNGSLVL